MALVNLTTDLKSLRYGNDRRGSADSGQPYIKQPIPDGNGPGLGDTDFLLRGGSLTPGRIADDVSRLTKMFFDFKSPNGLLFTVKQSGLSRTGVNIDAKLAGSGNKKPLNEGVYLPTSTLAQAALNPLGGHLLKQGINPFAETNQVANGNTLSTGFFGSLPLSLPLYLNTDAQNERQNWATLNVNELINIKNRGSRLIGFLNDKINSNPQDNINLYTYSGGPGSTLGIGETNIKLSSPEFRTGRNNVFLAQSGFYNTGVSEDTNFGFNYGVFGKKQVGASPYSFKGGTYFGNIASGSGKSITGIYQSITGVSLLAGGNIKTTNDIGNGTQMNGLNKSVFQTGSFSPNIINGLDRTLNYNQLQDSFDPTTVAFNNAASILNSVSLAGNFQQISTGSSNEVNGGGANNIYDTPTIKQDFRSKTNFTGSTKSLDYSDFNQTIEGRVNLGNPFRAGNRTSYSKGVTDPASGKSLGALDKINALPIYRSKNVEKNSEEYPVNDLVKFRIGVIDNNNPEFKQYIHFRAFLDSMDDSYSSEWSSQKFAGRAENLYNYQGFDRSINLSWTVAAQSKQELMPMYHKLNYLASICAPDYSDSGYMRGNLISLTVGGYLYEQVGIMQGINYTVPTESPWNIAIAENTTNNQFGIASDDPTSKEMPMIINVSGFNFIPIHNFVPNIQQNFYGGNDSAGKNDTGFVSTFGDERYISLANGKLPNQNNYDS
jgi:hypothetical protein